MDLNSIIGKWVYSICMPEKKEYNHYLFILGKSHLNVQSLHLFYSFHHWTIWFSYNVIFPLLPLNPAKFSFVQSNRTVGLRQNKKTRPPKSILTF